MKDVYKKFSTEKSTMDNYYITTESVCMHMYVHLHRGLHTDFLYMSLFDVTDIKTDNTAFILCYNS